MRKLNVIGVGSFSGGDLTLNGKKAIEDSQIVFCPISSGKRTALDSIKDRVNIKRTMDLPFPMGKMGDSEYKLCADLINNNTKDNEEVSFITIGDPSIYSTFYTLNEFLDKDFTINIVAGISSAFSGASLIKHPLIEKGESLLIVDEFPKREVLQYIDTIVILKTRGNKEELLNTLEEEGFKYWYLRQIGGNEEAVFINKEDIINDTNYMSIIIAKRKNNKHSNI